MAKERRAAFTVPPAPAASTGVLADIRHYFLARPRIPTLIATSSPEHRVEYSLRILQRVGIDVSRYRVLNIHRIGIEAPLSLVFQEILGWDGDAPCWPNSIATAHRLDGGREHIRIDLLGGLRRLPVLGRLFGRGLGPLFRLEALRLQFEPAPGEQDNARYALYRCHGGYPIGVFAIYARTPIADRQESEPSQVFMMVGFNFYGLRWWPGVRLAAPVWEAFHNRVTANVLNRFKDHCESRLRSLTGPGTQV